MSEYSVPFKVSLPNDQYHANPAIGSTSLKHILRSPAHFKYELENPAEPTPAKSFGTACHQAILEPKLFDEAIEMPLFEGKGSRAAKEEWRLANHGKLILKPDEKETIRGMLKSISRHKTARGLLSGGEAEQSFFWTDPSTGIVCKCRPDFVREGKTLVDVKTTTDAGLAAFQRDITNYRYHLSAAHYLAGVSKFYGEKYETFVIVAVEKDPPYCVQTFELDQPTIEKGEELRRRALLRLVAARQLDIFQGYPDEIVPINLTAWGWAE